MSGSGRPPGERGEGRRQVRRAAAGESVVADTGDVTLANLEAPKALYRMRDLLPHPFDARLLGG